jgi:hypothetical protein
MQSDSENGENEPTMHNNSAKNEGKYEPTSAQWLCTGAQWLFLEDITPTQIPF